MPPARLTLSLTALMPMRTGPRKLAPIPLLTIVAPSLIVDPLMPRSVEPPLWPAAQLTPAGSGTTELVVVVAVLEPVPALPCADDVIGPVPVTPPGVEVVD